jgi:hypothetical protein
LSTSPRRRQHARPKTTIFFFKPHLSIGLFSLKNLFFFFHNIPVSSTLLVVPRSWGDIRVYNSYRHKHQYSSFDRIPAITS